MRRASPSRVRNHNVVAPLIVVAALAAAGPAAAVTVQIDQNSIVELTAPAGSLLVGNPTMVDVTLLSPRKVAVFGRSYGVTNLIVLDRMGRTIFSQQVNVTPADSGRVSVYRGTQVSNFACSPRCERTPMPGEFRDQYEGYTAPYSNYNDRAKGEATGASQAGAP